MKQQKVNTETDYEGVTYRVTGTYYPATKGRYTGPPEKCYEGEAAYIDDMELFIGEYDVTSHIAGDTFIEIEGQVIDELWDRDHDNSAAYDKWKDDKLTGDA